MSVSISGPSAGQVIRPGSQTVTGTATGLLFPPVAIQSVTVNGQSATLTPIVGSLIVSFTVTVALPAWVPTATIIATAVDEFGTSQTASVTVRMGGGWVGGWSELDVGGENEQTATFDVATNADGRLEAFGILPGGGTTWAIWHIWQLGPGGPWNYWHKLSTDEMVLLAGARNADGRLELFGLKPGRPTIWHTWQTQPGGAWAGSWSELYTDNDELGEIKAAANKDGRLEVFGPYESGDFRHTWQTQPGGPWAGSWSQLYSAGTAVPIEGAAVTANADGRLEVSGLYDGDLWHAAQTQPGSWDGGEWHSLARPLDGLPLLGPVAAASNANGCLELFGVSGSETYAGGTDIWHIAQTKPGSWDGSTWGQLPSLSDLAGHAVSILSFAVEQNGDGRLELVALTDQSAMFRTGQNKPGTWDGATWTDFYGNDGPINSLRMARNADGRLEVFGINKSLSDLYTFGSIYHTWRDWDVPFEVTPTGVVPDVIGQSPDEATAKIQAAGFTFIPAGVVYVEAAGLAYVRSQSPVGGTTALPGSAVIVTIEIPTGWSGWTSLAPGVPFDGEPAVGRNADGRLQVFAQGTDSALWTMAQTAPGSNNDWPAWTPLAPGSHITSDPIAGINADGRLEVFARGTDNALWHIWQTAPGGGWSDWASLGGRLPGPAAARDVAVVARNADGRLEVFARGDNALWHNWQTAPGGGWSGWTQPATGLAFKGEPVVGRNADGRLQVFVQGTDFALWTITQDAPGSSAWSAWTPLAPGVPFNGEPAVASNADGHLQVFAQGTDSALRTITQTAPGSSAWSAWTPLAPGVTFDGEPVVASNADGRLKVFARGTDNALWTITQDAPGSSAWSAWAPAAPGVPFDGEPVVASNADGRLQVFARGTDNALRTITQSAPGS